MGSLMIQSNYGVFHGVGSLGNKGVFQHHSVMERLKTHGGSPSTRCSMGGVGERSGGVLRPSEPIPVRSRVTASLAVVFPLLTAFACGSDGNNEVAHVNGTRVGGASPGEFRVLAIVKTTGFRHGSIPDA